MQYNWVLLQGRLCHTPNYSATRKGLHKVAFRLAVPRPPRVTAGLPEAPLACPPSDFVAGVLPSLGSNSDYVTVIVIGKPAWDFKQLDLQMGAAVRVQGHLRSWDTYPREIGPQDARGGDRRDDRASAEVALREESEALPSASPPSREYRIEVIAEKIETLDDASTPA
jgi:hypothetical protein